MATARLNEETSYLPAPPRWSQPGLVMRKCACGAPAGLTDECPECSEKRLSVQRKVSTPGYGLELEADRIAEQVMGSLQQPAPMEGHASTASANGSIHRSSLDSDVILRQAGAQKVP